MVARGDLAVEVGKRGGAGAAEADDPHGARGQQLAITATQMMESMIVNASPTRAERQRRGQRGARRHRRRDAVGRDRQRQIPGRRWSRRRAAIVLEADRSETPGLDQQFLNETFTRVDQSIAYGALFTAFHLRWRRRSSALTESGSTAL